MGRHRHRVGRDRRSEDEKKQTEHRNTEEGKREGLRTARGRQEYRGFQRETD